MLKKKSVNMTKNHSSNYSPLGYTINSFTMDGKRVLHTVFKEYMTPMCHFHQKQIVQRYITKNPKLQGWRAKYENFLAEMTVNYETGEATYTHYKLREAYTSLCSNLYYLFTYKNNKAFCTPNKTNHLDGSKFSDLKNRIRVHRGLSKLLKKKLVDYYLLNNGRK